MVILSRLKEVPASVHDTKRAWLIRRSRTRMADIKFMSLANRIAHMMPGTRQSNMVPAMTAAFVVISATLVRGTPPRSPG